MKSENEFHTQEEYKKYLRIYFAAIAMQAIISRDPEDRRILNNIGLPDIPIVTEQAIAYADELLKQLKP